MAPNIQEYDATGSITPSDKGIEAAELAGRRLGQFGHEIAQQIDQIGDKIEQHESLLEISHLARHFSDGEAVLADSWSKVTSNPALKDQPHLASTFMETQVEPFIAEMQKHAGTRAGQEYALQTGDRIRQQFWRETMGDQAKLIGDTVHENTERVGNNATVSVARDPSQVNYEAQSKQISDTADVMASAIPILPGEVNRRTEWHDQYIATHMHDLTVARYQSMAASIAQDVGQTGDPTKTAAYAEAKQTYASDLKGADWVKGPEWVELGKGLDEAVHRGIDLYKSRVNDEKSKAVEEGKATYADIHSSIMGRILAGLPPTPEQVVATQEYARRYGATNPGEVASLDDYVERGAERAQENKVQPYNQQTRDNIQTSFGLPAGDPRRPTLPSLLRAYSHGLITKEDLSSYTEILGKLDKPETDPNFRPAWENFVRWQNQMIGSIGNNGYPGTGAARAQFLHDSTAAFMTQGKGGDWGKTLDTLTNAQNPGSFSHSIDFYKRAALRPDAAKWLQQHDQYDPRGLPAYGSTANPVYPTAPAAGRPAAPGTVSSDELKRANEIIWGHAPAQPTKLQQKDVDAIIWGQQH